MEGLDYIDRVKTSPRRTGSSSTGAEGDLWHTTAGDDLLIYTTRPDTL